MILLRDRTPPQLHSEEKGTLELSRGFQLLGGGTGCSLPLVDIGFCLPLMKGKEHSCYSQANSSGTAR